MSFIDVFPWIVRPLIPFKTQKQNPASKIAYLNLTLWGYLNWCMRRDSNLRAH